MMRRCPGGRVASALLVPVAIFGSVLLGAEPATSRPGSAAVSQPATAPSTWSPPTPPAAADRARERQEMVLTQLGGGVTDGRRAIRSDPVLQAIRTAPRHAFVPADRQRHAYDDTPLPIGHGQTISQPYIVGLMSELLELQPGQKVLEVGTGSGYQAAVLAHLTPHVYTIEIVEPLARAAEKALAEQKYAGVRCRIGDGYFGWPEEAPFDAIIVTCAAGHLPPPLWEQLKPGGRIVVPIGGPYELQRLVVLTKSPQGQRRSKTIIPVAFVPMTGEVARRKE